MKNIENMLAIIIIFFTIGFIVENNRANQLKKENVELKAKIEIVTQQSTNNYIKYLDQKNQLVFLENWVQENCLKTKL